MQHALVQSFLDEISWKAKVLKKQGRNWLIGASEDPQTSAHAFNGHPVLIQQVPNSQLPIQSVLASGSKRPSAQPYQQGQSVDPLQVSDPWARATSAPQQRSVQGPTEAALQSRNVQIKEIQSQMNEFRSELTAIREESKGQAQQLNQKHEELVKDVRSRRQPLRIALSDPCNRHCRCKANP